MTSVTKARQCAKTGRFTCDWIFNILVVLSDGKVVCGCADPYGERPLGDLKTRSLTEIWRSDGVRRIREELNRGHACFCDPCGLKRRLKDGEPVPQQEVERSVLPRVFLEPTVACNLSCFQAVCNRESGIIQSRNRTYFPMDQFRRVIDSVGADLVRLDLFNYGDPFVHPEAVDMVEYVKSTHPHIYLYTSTNGLKLDREKIRRLVAAPIDEITFSVDGPDQRTYVRYRRGGDFDKVTAIMKTMVEERDRGGREVPFINWRYILFRWNDSRRQMRRTRKLAHKLGVDRLTWEITDHPPEACSPRYQIGTPEWRRIHDEIWDSSQLGNAIKSRRYRARIRTVQKPLIMIRQKPSHLWVSLKNTGGMVWPRQTESGRRTVRLGAQLHDKNRELIDLNFARAFLNRTLERGQSDRVEMALPPVAVSGEYWLKFDLVSEGIDWFERAGSKPLWKRLTVMPE